MKPGDRLDPLALGHRAIDTKKLIQDCGYVMPQSSAGEIAHLPDAVSRAVDEAKALQGQYGRTGKTVRFECSYCGDTNSADERIDAKDGTVFHVCGNCDRVVKVV